MGTPGCEDTYWASIDCQWIDITGVLPGTYIFRVSINAEFKVAEVDFDNNALICQLDYNGVSVLARNCRLGPVDSMQWAPEGGIEFGERRRSFRGGHGLQEEE